MDLFGAQIVAEATRLFDQIDALGLEERITVINDLREALHQHSPFRDEPVDCVVWTPAETVEGNSYNPNTVAPPEMRLLRHSIEADGYTQPIVAVATEGHYTVIDGFHRSRIGKEVPAIMRRLHGYLPVAVIKGSRTDLKDRMAATIRHNRARGVHGVVPMTDVVRQLIGEGWTDAEICKEVGMDPDEVLRFKQATGLPELFKHRDYSRAWE